MPLTEGVRLDAYELVRPIGAGGMGEVWLATDVRLGRKVAVKLLPADLTRDSARVLRFEQEARAASALNHPNVCTILALGETEEDQHYIAMEFVEGRTLRERLSTSPPSLGESLDIVMQIASALNAAHRAGIVHRDIKPENVMLRPDGLVKVLDFGLAKLGEPGGSHPDSQTRAALQPALTEPGVVVGTVAYMSPEQARAEAVDARTDLFSLGAVMYELMTGRRAFPKAFDWTPPSTDGLPAALQPIVLRLLAPDVTARYRTAEDTLEDLLRVRHRGGSKRRPTVAWLAGAALIVAAIVTFAIWSLTDRRRPPASTAWVRLTNLPDSASQPALSPDGRMLAFIRGPDTFVTSGDVYVKALPDGDPVQLTRDASTKMSPAFSPDGLRIAYTVTTGSGGWDTWVLPVISGQPHLWLRNASGLTWLDRHRLLFSEVKDGDIHMAIVTADENRGNSHDVYVPAGTRGMAHRSYPSPDGRWALVVEMDRNRWLPCRLVPMSGGSAGQPVGPPGAACTFAAWTPDGRWMYLNANVDGAFHVWRQRFPDGEPERVASGLSEEEGLAIDPDGRSFLTSVGQRQSVVWLRHAGGERQVSLEGFSYDVKFTPDGKRLCYRILKGTVAIVDPSELRIADLDTGRNEPLLPGLAPSGPPGRTYDISPDGRWVIASASDKDGHARLWLAPLDRQSPPHAIPGLDGDMPFFAGNNTVVFRSVQGPSAFVYRASLDGKDLARVSNEAIAGVTAVSPDGEWVVVRTVDRSVKVIPLRGGGSVVTMLGSIGGDSHVAWAQQKLLISLPLSMGTIASGLQGKTYVLPVTEGRMLPRLPDGGFQSEADITATPGAEVIDGYDVALGPSAGTYAYSRQSVQRNVYRIPIQ